MNRNLTEVIIPFATLAERVGGAALRRQVERRASAFAAAFHRAWVDSPGMVRLRRLFAPGTPYGDLTLMHKEDLAPEARYEAVHRIARRIPPKLAEPASRQTLYEMAESRNVSPKDLLYDLFFPAGIELAVGERNDPRYIRFGDKWITDPNRKKALVRPGDLPLHLYARWVWQKARQYAVEGVLGAPPIITEPFSDEAADPRMTSNALKVLLAGERATEDVGIIETLYRMASPKERELLTLLRNGTDRADLPNQMRLDPSTIRVLLHRLRKKLASM